MTDREKELTAMLEKYQAIGNYDRLRELAEADRDGRCVVLPNPLTATDVEAIKDIGRIVNNLDTMAELVKKKEKKA